MSHLAVCDMGINTQNMTLDLIQQACKLLEKQGYKLGTHIKNSYVDRDCLVSFSSQAFPTGVGVVASVNKGFEFVTDPYGYQVGYQKAQVDFKQAYTEVALKHVLGRMGYAVMKSLEQPRLVATKL